MVKRKLKIFISIMMRILLILIKTLFRKIKKLIRKDLENISQVHNKLPRWLMIMSWKYCCIRAKVTEIFGKMKDKIKKTKSKLMSFKSLKIQKNSSSIKNNLFRNYLLWQRIQRSKNIANLSYSQINNLVFWILNIWQIHRLSFNAIRTKITWLMMVFSLIQKRFAKMILLIFIDAF